MDLELIIPFKKEQFTPDGTQVNSGKFIIELQEDWEDSFYNKFKPIFANVIEAHPLAMMRLTQYFECSMDSDFDFGLESIEGEIDIEINLRMENFLEKQTVFAVGSQLKENDDEPLFLVKNENLKMDILVFKYVQDNDSTEIDKTTPVTIDFNNL